MISECLQMTNRYIKIARFEWFELNEFVVFNEDEKCVALHRTGIFSSVWIQDIKSFSCFVGLFFQWCEK